MGMPRAGETSLLEAMPWAVGCCLRRGPLISPRSWSEGERPIIGSPSVRVRSTRLKARVRTKRQKAQDRGCTRKKGDREGAEEARARASPTTGMKWRSRNVIGELEWRWPF
ncbi:hypothetical protein Salat_0745000 [Sesamum alatum]|uniref:Uncharacterized protein n=1 Tax=Sesamum alatum TaxID=300844 RepID=A0AAE2CVA7_9LAMI|nr:hypothetical protein Salat_0745000 [Sesamum alatum]